MNLGFITNSFTPLSVRCIHKIGVSSYHKIGISCVKVQGCANL